MTQVERYETVIVGGGQAGLSVGYHLKQQGRSFVILDASERIGDSWRNRWDSLRLYSPAFRDGLPGMPFPAPRTTYPTKDEMGDYLEAYATRFELPVRSGTAVETLTKEDGRYVANAGDERFEADNVVVATGVFQQAVHAGVRGRARSEHHPASLQRLPQPVAAAGRAGARRGRRALGLGHRLRGIRVTRRRSSPARTPARSRCRSRAGADGSASGCSCSRHARPQRRHADGPQDAPAHPARRRAAPPLPQEGSPRGRSRARRRANRRRRARPSRARRRSRPRRAQRRLVHRFPARLQLDSRSVRDAATDGYPVQYRGAVASSPGLYFAGLPFLHSFASMLIAGSARDAERVARHIVKERTPRLDAKPDERRAGDRIVIGARARLEWTRSLRASPTSAR